MKRIVAALLMTSALAYAGVNRAWDDFRFDLHAAKSALEEKKGKFSEAEFSQLSAELKDAQGIMLESRGISREDYYKVAKVQEERVMKVKAVADAKQ